MMILFHTSITMKHYRLGLITLALLSLIACSRTVVGPTDLENTPFPHVHGTNLKDEVVTIPDQYQGKPTLLLIGYKQNAQFDIDRWILGALQAGIKTQIVEVPTIVGMMPRVIQSYINNGMRSGIPSSDWGSVVTVYEDAEKIISVLGNERPRNAYAVLLDRSGIIVWSSNSGYSAAQILALKDIVNAL